MRSGVICQSERPLRQRSGRFCRRFFHRFALAPRLCGVDPRREVRWGQLREVHQRIGDVALRVNHHGGHFVERGLFQQIQAEACLARTGHAHHHRVGDQVVGIVQQGLFCFFVGFGSLQRDLGRIFRHCLA
jgi:hypothetical protein